MHNLVDPGSFIEVFPGSHVILSRELKIIAVNKPYLSGTLVEKASILGCDILDVIPDLIPGGACCELRDSLNRVLTSKKKDTLSIEVADFDGVARCLTYINTPIMNETCEIACILHTREDLGNLATLSTAPKFGSAEVTRPISDRRFSPLFDNLLEGVQVIDFKWVYLYVNDAAVRQARYNKEELLGYAMMERYPGIEHSELFKVLQRCMEKRVSERFVNEFAYPDQSLGYFELSVQPVPEGLFILSIDITDMKKAEAETRKLNNELEIKVSERTVRLESIINLFSTLFEGSPAPMAIFRQWDGTVLNVNRAFLGLFEYDAIQHVVGRIYSELGVFGDETTGAWFGELLESAGEIMNDEVSVLTTRGCRKWISLSVQTVELDEAPCLLAVFIDITHRKEYEERLKKFSYFFNHTNDMCCIANTEGYFELINPNFEKTLKYSSQELIENRFFYFIHPEDIAATEREITKLANGTPILNFINRFRDKEGNYFWFEWNAAPDPKTGKLYAIGRNITKHVETESVLRRSLKEISDYKYALDESSIVAIADKRGIITYVNENFCKISKYSAAELLGQDHRIVNSGYHSKDFFRDLWTSIRDGKVWRGEIRNRAKDGRRYWVDTTIVPFIDGRGEPYQYVAIRNDITERKKAEEQLIESNAELESFSYSVAHDLRAPLRIVDGYAAMLLEESKQGDAEMQRYVDVIRKNVRHMGQLIDDLLSFSRLGRLQARKELTDIRTLVNSVVEEHMMMEKSPRVQITVGDLHAVRCDGNLIRQVFVNLISNAIKYSSPKERSLVEIKSEIKDHQVIFSVQDNGVGFDIRYADKLFGVFQRLHKIGEFEGTGVGLAIVQRVVQKHGGRVWVETEINVGTTFYFSLPLDNINQ